MLNTISLTTTLLTALLSSIPRVPQPQRGRIEQRRETIIAQATASAERYHVPVVILLSVALLESHWGTDSMDPDWGAPRDRNHRHIAGNSDNAASALLLGFNRCHTWTAAVHHFRSGRCHSMHLLGYQPSTAIHLAERVMDRAGVELPEHWR